MDLYNLVIAAKLTKGGGGGDHDAEDGIIQRTLSGTYVNSRIESIGAYAFAGCSSVTEFAFSNIKEILNFAFSGCANASKIVFNKLSWIGNSVFQNCKSLMNLTILESSVVQLYGVTAFKSTPMSSNTYTGSFGSIYVPASLVSDYKVANNWSAYADRITSYVE